MYKNVMLIYISHVPQIVLHFLSQDTSYHFDLVFANVMSISNYIDAMCRFSIECIEISTNFSPLYSNFINFCSIAQSYQPHDGVDYQSEVSNRKL